MSRRVRTLIVDDEPLARRGLELRLAGQPDIEVVGQCGDGAAAMKAVSALSPDLMFLDVQMPGLDGFGTLKAIPATQLPLVVFVTAYDHYALRAFESSAVDYLLKPVEDSRLHQALYRVREQLEQREAARHCEKLLHLLGDLSGKSLSLEQALQGPGERKLGIGDRLSIKDGQRTVRVELARVRWVDAAGDYMCIHTDGETFVLRATMRELEDQLDPRQFPRVHRSTLVNAARVVEMRPHLNGEQFLTLDCGHEIKLSRSYRTRIELLR